MRFETLSPKLQQEETHSVSNFLKILRIKHPE